MIKITGNPILAVGVAITLHAIWNGSLWVTSILVKDSSTGLQILCNLVMIVVLITLLWVILRRLIPFAILDDEYLRQEEDIGADL